MSKNPTVNVGDTREVDLTSGLRRSPGGGSLNCSSNVAEKFHGQTSLMGYSPWDHRSDTTEHPHTILGVEVLFFIHHGSLKQSSVFMFLELSPSESVSILSGPCHIHSLNAW